MTHLHRWVVAGLVGVAAVATTAAGAAAPVNPLPTNGPRRISKPFGWFLDPDDNHPQGVWSEANSVSADGSVVVYTSNARKQIRRDRNETADVFVHETQSGRTRAAHVGRRGRPIARNPGTQGCAFGNVSADGGRVVYCMTDRSPGFGRIMLYDRERRRSRELSVDLDGRSQAGILRWKSAIAGDGSLVAIDFMPGSFVPEVGETSGTTYLANTVAGTFQVAVMGRDGMLPNDGVGTTSISANGRFLAFASRATNLVEQDVGLQCNVYLHDREAGVTLLASRGLDGGPADDHCYHPVVSDTGRVAFLSWATNLVPGDTNGVGDIFVFDPDDGTVRRVSVAHDGSELLLDSTTASISADGNRLLFNTASDGVVPGDANGIGDVYLADL
jgi:Tol biopolymer transport system component